MNYQDQINIIKMAQAGHPILARRKDLEQGGWTVYENLERDIVFNFAEVDYKVQYSVDIELNNGNQIHLKDVYRVLGEAGLEVI